MPEIKSFPFPVLSPDSVDYDEGLEYSAKIARTPGANAVRVRHNLVGDSLVSHLLRDGTATFACIVSVPTTMYRRIFVADSRAPDCQQEVDYSESGHGDDTDAVESPMFRPVILAKEAITKKAEEGAGLGELWAGSTIEIPDGAIIAFDDWARFGGEGGGLLIVEKAGDLENGQMEVSADAAAGFRFRVRVGGVLYDKLQSPEGHARHRVSVLTHALSAAFQILKDEYKNKREWSEYINLRLVADKLERENAGHWSDSNFLPERAATVLYPHIFDDTLVNDDDDA